MEISTGMPFWKRVIRSKAFSLFLLFAILCVLFTILASVKGAKFFNSRTFITILQDITVPGFLAIGAGYLLVSGGVDLSQWAAGALAGMIIAVGIAWWGLSWYLVIIMAITVSALVGFINAIFVNKLGMAPFIATMAMTSIIRAIIMLLSTTSEGILKGSVNFEDAVLNKIAYAAIGGVPVTALVMVAFFIAYGFILAKTQLGRSIYLIGGNQNAAKLSGINSEKINYFLYINCSMMGGLAGLVYSFRAKQGNLQALSNEQFTGMTAAILGGISFGGGSGGLVGAFIGLFVIKTFSKGMLIISSNTFLTSILSGILLLAALTFDYLSQKRQQRLVGVRAK